MALWLGLEVSPLIGEDPFPELRNLRKGTLWESEGSELNGRAGARRSYLSPGRASVSPSLGPLSLVLGGCWELCL